MFNDISFGTKSKIGPLDLFTLEYRSDFEKKVRSLKIIFTESENSCIAFIDNDLLNGNSYEIRGDGVWFDANCEKPKEHWSFSMESFALRIPVEHYLDSKDSLIDLLVGDRIPFGFEIDVESENGQDWDLIGEILVEQSHFELNERIKHFELK